MDRNLDETTHVIFLGKFESNKKYKEQILQEILAAVCAMLNSNGGKVVIHFDTDSSIPVEGIPFSQIPAVIRLLEQHMISIIGLHQTVSKVNFRDDKDSIIIFIKKADSLVTIDYNLYLPIQTQVVEVSPLEPPQKVKDIICREAILNPVQLGSHCQTFSIGETCALPESKTRQLKNLKAGSSKRTSLADRMTGKGNKFSCYVSAFSNHSGGHIYYGIRDDGVVEGEFIPSEKGKDEITKKVEKAINKMILPEQIRQPKRGEHWEIFFEPVVDENSKPVPSTFVIVIYIAPCLGGVFSEEPKCYDMVEGKVQKMSFTAWKERISTPENSNDQSSCSQTMMPENVNNQSTCSQTVPYAVPRIQWSSNKIKRECAVASKVLMELINNGSWKEFERKASIFQKIFSQNQEVVLIVLSKMVIAYARQGLFDKAQGELSRFCEIYTNVVDSPFFSALAMYLQIVLKRKQKDFCGIDELLGSALAEAESIEIGCLTAAIHLLVATVTSFKERKSESNQDKLCNTAIEHLDYVLKPDSITWDMKQKAYITLVLSNLNCVLSKDIILAKKCTESDLREAKSAMKAFNEVALESPLNRFRKIQSELANAVLHYRQAQIKKDATESNRFLVRAFDFAKQAEALATVSKFDEMNRWSKQLISACSAELLWNRLNMPKEEQELGDV